MVGHRGLFLARALAHETLDAAQVVGDILRLAVKTIDNRVGFRFRCPRVFFEMLQDFFGSLS
jgi:hypothetical protein